MDSVRAIVSDAPAEDDIRAIERNLMAYNAERVGCPYDIKPLAVFLRGVDGALLGGLTGYTNWGWLYVDCLWVSETLRGGGWGSRLLEAAEQRAIERGCRNARLFTYDFQALDFYRRHGYALFGTLDDYPPGHRQHWLRKALA